MNVRGITFELQGKKCKKTTLLTQRCCKYTTNPNFEAKYGVF